MSTENYTPAINVNDDPVFEEPSSDVIAGSGLDLLQAALKENVRMDNYEYAVPARKTLRLILDPNIDGEQFQHWQRGSIIGKSRGADSQVDSVKLAAVVIANCTVGVEVRRPTGEYTEVRDSSGMSMDFRNKDFRKMLVGDDPVSSSPQLVRKLFGNDGHMLECSRDLMEKAGYGEESDEGGYADPLE